MIGIKVNDSPKLYFRFQDIYGENFSPPFAELKELSYSVFRYDGGYKTPVPGFHNVPIPKRCWHSTPARFPAAIQGLSDEEIAKGFTLELFPYVVNPWGALDSPFKTPNSTYAVVVTIAYYMDDDAFYEPALIRKQFKTEIVTGASV